jgi:cutinase
MGPIICTALKKAYGARKVLCQGVGGPYTAGIADNIGLKGTSAAAIKEGTRMFTAANTKCPQSVIVFGGYRSELLLCLARKVQILTDFA